MDLKLKVQLPERVRGEPVIPVYPIMASLGQLLDIWRAEISLGFRVGNRGESGTGFIRPSLLIAGVSCAVTRAKTVP